MKKVIIIAGAVVVAVGVFVAGFYTRPVYDNQQNNQAKGVAEAFIKDVTAGKNDAAYSLTSSSLQSKQNKDAFTKALGDLKSDKPSYNQAQYMIRDGKFYYSQRVLNLPKTSSGSTSGDFLLTLNKQGASWKVSTVSVQ